MRRLIPVVSGVLIVISLVSLSAPQALALNGDNVQVSVNWKDGENTEPNMDRNVDPQDFNNHDKIVNFSTTDYCRIRGKRHDYYNATLGGCETNLGISGTAGVTFPNKAPRKIRAYFSVDIQADTRSELKYRIIGYNDNVKVYQSDDIDVVYDHPASWGTHTDPYYHDFEVSQAVNKVDVYIRGLGKETGNKGECDVDIEIRIHEIQIEDIDKPQIGDPTITFSGSNTILTIPVQDFVSGLPPPVMQSISGANRTAHSLGLTIFREPQVL